MLVSLLPMKQRADQWNRASGMGLLWGAIEEFAIPRVLGVTATRTPCSLTLAMNFLHVIHR